MRFPDRGIARDRPSRYETRAFPRRSNDREGQALALRFRNGPDITVGRGPSHATRACERVSRAMRLAGRPPHLCRSGSPDPDPIGSRRSRTTKHGRFRGDRGIARDRPSRYDIRDGSRCYRRARACPAPVPDLTAVRGPVPRQRYHGRTIARDRPSRYEMRAFPRRSRDREGQALALRNTGVSAPVAHSRARFSNATSNPKHSAPPPLSPKPQTHR